MRWADVEAGQPQLAALASARLIDPGVVLVVTMRKDGTPRLSPVEPYVMDGELWLAMMWQSQKAKDLLRDARVLVHSIVVDREGTGGEIKVRGTATSEEDVDVQQRYADEVAEALGWHPEVGQFHLFRLDVDSIVAMRYEQPSGDQHVAMWPPAREFVRRITSATSVGEPEPMSELLDPP